MSDPGLLTAFAELLLEGLKAAGVRDVVLSPGSRSTPWVAAAVRTGFRIHDVVDERAAAFFALGQARATGRPSLLLCTSGTAGAHYFPALLEAEADHLPMLVLTADRPHGLVGCGAPQTMDQGHLFGRHVRGFFELGEPVESTTGLLALRRIAVQAHTLSLHPTPGPVHLNARADKPLEPTVPGPALAAQLAAVRAQSLTQVLIPSPTLDPSTVEAVAARLSQARRVLVAIGPRPRTAVADRAPLEALLAQTGWVVYAEATSQLRGAATCSGDLFNILHSVEDEALTPDLVLELGAPPSSAAYARLLARSRPARIVVQPHGHSDPQQNAERLVLAEPGLLLEALAGRPGWPAPDLAYRQAWASARPRAEAALEAVLDAASGPTELGMVRTLLGSLPPDAVLVVGNSLAVRHLDQLPASSPLEVLSQRGVSGIDGLVAGTAGAGAVDPRPYALLLGDLSLFHDLSSLGLLARAQPTVVVVLNNDGGHIFDQLPIADTEAWAELQPHFCTPHGRTFRAAAELYDLAYQAPQSETALGQALATAWKRPGPSLIEAAVPAEGARRVAQALRAELQARRP